MLLGNDNPFVGGSSQGDEGEFTPRNVQTTEGCAATAFVIELAVQNENGKLKPAMPADVYFGQ
jgi:hypothetical protein